MLIKPSPDCRAMAVLLVRYSEIGLKSMPVRMRFESRMRENMIQMLAADGVEALVGKSGARFLVECADVGAGVRSLRRVFGVASISVCESCAPDLDSICAKAAEYSKTRLVNGKTFAVKARREGNQKFTSMDVGRLAGDAIWNANLDKSPKVDLTNPDVIFWIEVRPKAAYLFDSYISCHAGFPLGTQGRVVADVEDDRGLLSAWLMMKRGCKVLVRGGYGREVLSAYDPSLKDADGHSDRVLGYVKGWSLKEVECFNPNDYDLPVFFPTVGMRDAEVAERLKAIKEEAAGNRNPFVQNHASTSRRRDSLGTGSKDSR